MRRYSAFQALFLSFFSQDLYRDVARAWRGLGLLYLLLLIAVVWIPRTIQFHLMVSHFVNQRAPGIVHQIPPFRIQNGHVVTDVPMPYFVRDPDGGAVLAILDTTGKIASLDSSDARILVTSRRAILRKSSVETRTFEFAGIRDFGFDQPKGMHWLSLIGAWFAAGVMFVGFLGLYLWTVVKACVIGVIGMLMASRARAGLGYDAVVRLAAVALTPAYVIGVLGHFAHVTVPLWWCVAFLMTLGFLWLGVQANAAPAAAAAAATPPEPPAA